MADLVNRIVKIQPSDKLEGFCELVEKTKLSELERNIIYDFLYSNTRLIKYKPDILIPDDPEIYKNYIVLYKKIVFNKKLKENTLNIISCISDYKNDEYVDDGIKLLQLLKTGKRWNLLYTPQLPDHILFIKFLKENDLNDNYDEIKKRYYKLYDDKYEIMLSGIKKREYSISRKYKFLLIIDHLYREFFNINISPKNFKYFHDYQTLLIDIELYYKSVEILDIFALKYYSQMVNNKINKKHFCFKILDIQNRYFIKNHHEMSLHDIISSYIILIDLDRLHIKKYKAKIKDLIADNYDLILKFKNYSFITRPFIKTIAVTMKILNPSDLSNKLEKDFNNYILRWICVKANKKFCLQFTDKNSLIKDCIICMEDIQINDKSILCINCDNIIGHINCAEKYIIKSRKCPVCRN